MEDIMLTLKGITKIYDVADEKVKALRGVDIAFRRSEFVSILGPSGCGKTTLLNIIGGLDRYTEGNMEINGVSTAEYADRDWDSYRNHSIGFVFQNYNLIPHLTVLDNIELALTLVGEDKEKRTARAIAALERVGLRNKAYKKPNQLSGGQMQRVAIARAIINDPDIILADEPTGALDSETSVQIMSILKDISKTRLVVMVTHNGELAREYSTRIIRLFDGKVVGDTDPFNPTRAEERAEAEAARETEETKKFTPAEALRLTGNGVSEDRSALTERELYSCSRAYLQVIEGVQFAILTTDKGKLITLYTTKLKKTVKREFYEKKAVFGREAEIVAEAFGLKETADEKTADRQKKKYEAKPAMKPQTAFKLSLTNILTKRFRTFLTVLSGSIGIIGIALVLGLYSGLNGFIDRQEVALASSPITITRYSSNEEAIVDAVVSSLDSLGGKYDKNKVYIYQIVQKIISNQTKVNEIDAEMVDALEKQIDKDLYYDIYKNYGVSFNTVKAMKKNSTIFGITVSSNYYMTVNSDAYWTQMPTKELVLEQYEVIAGHYPTNKNEIVVILDGKNQISDINLFFNGLNMDSVSLNYKEETVNSESTMELSELLGHEYRIVDNDYYYHDENGYRQNVTNSPNGQMRLINDEIKKRVSGYELWFFRGENHDDESSYTFDFGGKSCDLKVSGVIKLKEDVSVGILGSSCIGYTAELTEEIMRRNSPDRSVVTKQRLDSYLAEGARSDWEISSYMKGYGYATIPSSISIYCRGYDQKTAVKAAISNISDQREAAGKSGIVCSDVMSIVVNIIKQFIDIITCALLSLTAISLIVSALMIGIITYVSVLERTREIGVLRALGARKTDISLIFNAENLIIGCGSGIVGVLLTYVISWPLGSLLASLTGIGGLVALPWYFALGLIGLSTLLTLFAGLIPATIAKRKDPVKALRAE